MKRKRVDKSRLPPYCARPGCGHREDVHGSDGKCRGAANGGACRCRAFVDPLE